ncbi:MAG: hypothetical protein IPN65_08410 [Elusimicrobia bacterium]|nr:hypothetical protein [Elusimicrobiota bacterium]MBK7207195.1 hypothetical protein [Elusimicrobiota bacterium]MBK7546001.1 hypothetical protein [Elusimicrobiota bacterium]MBK7574877.1 hypothetical protein [Elusimicrobiota bacterium]MBK7687473.1 hypothetical protein [Elusimicrobiota bacterium]
MRRFFWRGRRVLVTAGPTREHLDPVRFLSNESSGAMGWALAEAARDAGARVTLVAGPTGRPAPRGVTTVPVVSARDMLAAARRGSRTADVLIGAAAVADWRPARSARSKLKKGRAAPVLRLVPNPDILATLSREARPGALRVGFALETHRLLARAREKMRKKKLDLIVANPPAALGGERTRAWLLTTDGAVRAFAGSKKALARLILNTLERRRD